MTREDMPSKKKCVARLIRLLSLIEKIFDLLIKIIKIRIPSKEPQPSQLVNATRVAATGHHSIQPFATHLSQLAAVGDLDGAAGCARARPLGLDRLDQVHPLDDLAEDAVLAVQMGGGHGGDEKLGTVGVGTGVGHGEESRLGVLSDKVLVRKLVACSDVHRDMKRKRQTTKKGVEIDSYVQKAESSRWASLPQWF